MSKELFHWFIVSSIGAFFIAMLLMASHFLVIDDPEVFYRYIVVKLIGVITGLISLTGGMLFIDFITPDDWLSAIGKNHISCAMVVSAVVVVLGFIISWS